MKLQRFGKFANSFGLIRADCHAVASEFQQWQRECLSDSGFRLQESTVIGPIENGLAKLLPRTAPITTRYLIWPLNERWTLYFDNGRLGTDAGPPRVLSARLQTDTMRVAIAEELMGSGKGKMEQYGATIFEYYEKGQHRRHVYAVNDGGRWVFNQGGVPFDFEEIDAYTAHRVRDRFKPELLLGYLQKLGASFDRDDEELFERGPGYLLTKSGKMPRDYEEY